MNNELINYHHEMFGDIRAIEKDGEPWFVGKDVAVALGYANTRKAIADHVDDEDKGVTKCDTLGGEQDVTIINESGLYSLVLSSKLPSAKQFKHWVTAEVLPSIRRHGAYATAPTLEHIIAQPEFGLAHNLLTQKLKEMNNELINFHHEMFGDIRAIEQDGEPWFVGKDVAEALGYNNTRDALYKHVDEEDKRDGVAFRDTIGREQKMTIINESGLYGG